MSGYSRIIKAVRTRPWAILPAKLEAIIGFLELKAQGVSPSKETLDAIHADAEIAAARAANVSASSSGSVTVIPVYGTIMHRADLMSEYSGGTSTESLTKQLRQAVNDPNVKAIVMDFDSPGGTVDGVEELATEILNARSKKKITAVSNCLCCSAAYWLASCCTDVVVSPSSLTGSVGVYSTHEDDSKYLEDLGVKITLISYGENKTAGNSFEPLSDSARVDLQKMVDDFGAKFEKGVAKGRKTSQAKVRDTFGQGKVFNAEDAVKIGMADSVGTLDDVLSRYGVTRNPTGATSAAADVPAVSAEEPPAELEEVELIPVAGESREEERMRMQRAIDIAAA